MSAFDPDRVRYEDDALIVVDKPEGVSCQAADPDWPDDLPTRLRRFLAERDGDSVGDVYLGIHQRLDKDTSGLVLYAKARAANRGLAEQFEGRTVRKEYRAVVQGWRGEDRRLVHRLASGPGGKQVVVQGRDRKGKRAVTSVAVVTRVGPRALLALTIETGRTHQIRAQLAAVGAPVVGDAAYGGAPAPRLLLHASGLALAHPVTAEPIAVRSRVPAVFEACLEGRFSPFQPGTLHDSLARAAERRFGLHAMRGRSPATTAYRLVHEAADGTPGLAVDAYGEWLVAQLRSDEATAAEDAIVDALAEDPRWRGIYLKRRPRQANVVVDSADEALSPSAPVRGEPAPDPLWVEEDGLRLAVRLGDGLSTGLFLDQRGNRARIRSAAKGRRVLNLFAYTGAFTVAAAVGGARETVTVDASARVLTWAEENLRENGISPGEAHRLWKTDALAALRTLAQRAEGFDIVVCDPPTYSTTKGSRWTSGRDWRRLAAACLTVLVPGGVLLAASNDRRMAMRELRRHLHDAARDVRRDVRQMKELKPGADYPTAVGEERSLKAILLR